MSKGKARMQTDKEKGFRADFYGEVVSGNRLGRTIGFPTANIRTGCEAELEGGVFACRVRIGRDEENGLHYGMLNIGTRPTVSQGLTRSIEVHILDFSGDLYGIVLQIEILFKIRDEMRFSGLAELQSRLEQDKKEILHRLRESRRTHSPEPVADR